MRAPFLDTRAALLATVTLLPWTVTAITFECGEIVSDGVTFNFKKLGGEKKLIETTPEPDSKKKETTISIDICEELPHSKKEEDKCPAGTRICKTSKLIDKNGNESIDEKPNPIVRGNLPEGGYEIDAKYTLLSKSPSNSDRDKEGLRMGISGGRYNNRKERAIIEFLCKKDGDEERKLSQKDKEDDGGDADEGGDGDEDGDGDGDDGDKGYKPVDDGQGGTLEFIEWDQTLDLNILRLNWYTKFACENAAENGDTGDSTPSGGWGFFSWFFFLLFLGIIGYFGFFMWINYSKYGAQGWDLIPHSDTIRDIPYILGDLGRKIVGSFTGGPSRGGYSAV